MFLANVNLESFKMELVLCSHCINSFFDCCPRWDD
jgi:hypothetical protein